MALHTNARPPALNAWYDKATAEIQAVYAFVGRLAVE
jgi:hypothetical protein